MKISNQLDFNLPEDILIQIFLLLPFESILVTKLVSKQWNNLINDPNFFNDYNIKSSISLFFRNDVLCCLLKHTKHEPKIRHLPIHLRASLRSQNPPHYKRDRKLLSGLSNGVTCVNVVKGDFVFYNLVNGDSFTVTDAPLRQHFDHMWLCFGFGYDRFDDEYKIMVVCSHNSAFGSEWGDIPIDTRNVQNEDNSVFWVYSLRDRFWKSRDGFPYANYGWDISILLCPRGCSFNGVLHWVVGIPKGQVIVTYDLHTFMFGEILVPAIYEDEGSVAELDGYLCYKHDCGLFVFELWVMKEYGVVESWTKWISHSRGLGYSVLTGIYECRDYREGVLLSCDFTGLLYWYDLDDRKMIKFIP